MTKIISLDFECCSTLDLAEVGAYEWTRSPETLPILCGYALDYDEPVSFEFDWLSNIAPCGFPAKVAETCCLNNRLLSAVQSGAEVHAWNANFEWNVWNNICAPRFGWPELPIERFHCTMATAACAGLPMDLADAALAVNASYVKDRQGHAIMKRMARPRSRDVHDNPIWWHRSPDGADKLKALVDYNLADVRAEREVHLRMPRMSRREREIWLADQHMNARGLPVDKELVTALMAVTLQELLCLNQEIAKATLGEVSSSSQNGKLLAWLNRHGYPLTTLERDELDKFVKTSGFTSLLPGVRRVLELRAESAKTSTAKLRAIQNYSRSDGVARNLVQYGGAVRTLRWAGRGPQIQNFPRPVIPNKLVPQAIEEILAGMDGDSLRHLFGKPLDVVSSCLRGCFKAPEGSSFVVCDYSAIEAIVLAWLAGDQALLDVFRRKEDVYVYTANRIGSTNRQLGKVLVLACGYGMGHVKFRATAESYGLDLSEIEARNAVAAYREANKPIVNLWKAAEYNAISAIRHPGCTFLVGDLSFRMADPAKRLAGALLMTLPSGRNLAYRNASTRGGRIVFWGVHQVTRKWQQLDTYGGRLVENGVQAAARDLLADAVVKLERKWPGVLRTTIHDEIVALANGNEAPGVLADMQWAMSTTPAWGAGLPLSCKGAIVSRYGKLD